jgi:plasmid maintenance system antidote protein VapI
VKLVGLVKGEATMATRDSLAEIVNAEPKKYSQAELGRILGVSRARVHQIVNKLDLHHLVRPAYPGRNEGGATKDTAHKGRKLRTMVFDLYNREYSSLVEAARAMGISNSQIYRVKRGERAINEKFITGALKAFPKYRLDDLFYVVPDGSDDD